jgi:hypothetical protein
MTPSEISHQLPNGFHGASIDRISVDYLAKQAEFYMQLLVPGDVSGQSRRRGGRFEVTGIAFCTLEVPSVRYDYTDPGAIEIGSLLDTTEKLLPALQDFRKELGESYFFHSFFVEQWNGFIHFAGTEAKFEWMGA